MAAQAFETIAEAHQQATKKTQPKQPLWKWRPMPRHAVRNRLVGTLEHQRQEDDAKAESCRLRMGVRYQRSLF